MNPFLQLQEDTAARLAEAALLAGVPIVTETLGNVTNRISVALLKGGLKENEDKKAGLAILIITPKGRGSENTRTISSQFVTVRVAIFCKPVINDGPRGLQKHPLEVQFAVLQQMLSWDRGPGYAGSYVTLANWDSRETPDGQLSYYGDYDVPMILTL